jgi:hypothetical protein
MKVQFQLNIVVDEVAFKEGDIVDSSKILAGSLESMKRLGQVVEVAEEKKSK